MKNARVFTLRGGWLSLVTAGFVMVLVGVTSSAAIVFQAARAAGADQAETTSWMLALAVGMAVTSIGLSLRYRKPVATAWSTPGAALLATSLHGVSMRAAIGAFLFSAVLIIAAGVTGWFERIMDRVPMPLASALLAGVLVRFGMDAFAQMKAFGLVFPMFAVYVLCRRFLPRYAIVFALLAGVVAASIRGELHTSALHWSLARPVFTAPSFSLQALIGVGIPLFVVTMASQNLPGVAVIRGAGYDTPISPLITWTGVATFVLAPFGGFAINLAAITAAIGMGEEAHPDPRKRYWAPVVTGVIYLVVGLFGGVLVVLLTAFPAALVAAIAGLGLLGTIGGSLASAMGEEDMREAALVTFLTTASGLTLLHVGSAFWGLIGGVLVLVVLRAPFAAPARGLRLAGRRSGSADRT